MARYTIEAGCQGYCSESGLLVFSAIIAIQYTVTPGSSPTRDDPGADPEVEFFSASAEPNEPMSLLHRDAWARWWLETNYDEALANAAEQDEPDPDDARDRAMEDAQFWAETDAREAADERRATGEAAP